jgi:hypothetical protein
MNVWELGVAYRGITLVSRFLTLPPDGPWPEPLYLARVTEGSIHFYQFLALADPDFAMVSYYNSPFLPVSTPFPYGFDVAPD